MTMANRVLLYGKPGCHLCDDALVTIKRVCDDLAVGFRQVDISQDANLMNEYGEQIPVTFVDGRQHDYWRVDEARLRKALG
ncbi:MAG: glutaredoxin family protein [Nocardioidaceae bacterium]|jgi:glutaredoxin